MHKSLEKVCSSLDDLAAAVLSGWSGDSTLQENWGWNNPPLTRHDLASIPNQFASTLREANLSDIPEDILHQIEDTPRKLMLLKAIIPYFYNGHSSVAVPIFINTIDYFKQTLSPLTSWQINNDPNAMPPKIARRLRSINAQLDEISPNKEELTKQIKLIQDAVETAEALPIDLQTLKETHTKVTKISDDSVVILGKITPREEEAANILKNITAKQEQANKLVEQCEEVYRITTTKGLAGAFETKAKSLSSSIIVWVICLIVALFFAVDVGSKSFDNILTHLNQNATNWSVVLMDMLIAILSIGGPVWFAWVATKQIGQRFRLAEDYAFKASVAKAYEGYRKEAARIDPVFEARLFSSALSRLDEPPLRLVEQESHGSPWHELFASKPFQKAMDTIPEFKEKFIEVSKDGINGIKSKLDGKKTEET